MAGKLNGLVEIDKVGSAAAWVTTTFCMGNPGTVIVSVSVRTLAFGFSESGEMVRVKLPDTERSYL